MSLEVFPALPAVGVGIVIGLSLGALGGGGSILTVPVLVLGFGLSAQPAMTGSLVVVAATSLVAAAAAHRGGHVLLGRGVAVGGLSVLGALLGARLSAGIGEDLLMALFSLLMLAVGLAMLLRERRLRRTGVRPGRQDGEPPLISFSPVFVCRCPRAVFLALVATVVGLLTGLLGVGGGFLVVPALVLALGMPLRQATGTSLVAIAVTSLVALAARVGTAGAPPWPVVLPLALASAVGAVIGVRLARRVDVGRLSGAFTGLVLATGVVTAVASVPALV